MIFYWPAAAVVLLLSDLVLRPFHSDRKHRRMGQTMLGRMMGGFIGMLELLGIIEVSDESIRNQEDIPGPLIIACNHPAMWDALLVMRRFLRVSCIMKTELLANPLLGGGARFAGFLPNEPKIRMMRKAIERLNSGGRLLYFPEGTRTRAESGAVNGFRPGLAMLARESGAQVVPVFISTDSRYLGKGWPIAKRPELPIIIRIRLGETVTMAPGEGVRDFTERLEGIFRKELA